MPKRTKSYEVDLHERLRDPEYAMEYLRAALEDEDEHADAVFLLALRDVAQANQMSYVAEATGLNRESLYKMLSHRGNPGINSLKAVLSSVGLKLSVQVAERKSQTRAQWGRLWGEAQTVAVYEPEPQLTYCAVDESIPGVHYDVGWESQANPPPKSVCSAGETPLLPVLKLQLL
jgi:probable addiction module antidote protein